MERAEAGGAERVERHAEEPVIEADDVNPPHAERVDALREKIPPIEGRPPLEPGRASPPRGHEPGLGGADDVAQKSFVGKFLAKRRRNNLKSRAHAAIVSRDSKRLKETLNKLQEEELMTKEEIREFLFDSKIVSDSHGNKIALKQWALNSYTRSSGRTSDKAQNRANDMQGVLNVLNEYQPGAIRKIGTAELFEKLGGQAAIAKEVAGLAKRGDQENFQKLINEFGSVVVNLPDQDGVVPFQHACDYAFGKDPADTKFIKFLIDAGVDAEHFNVRNSEGETPFLQTCQYIMDGNEELELVGIMIQSGADVNTALPSGKPLFQEAALRGPPELLKVLLDRNQIDVNQISEGGHTALQAAALRGGDEGLEVVKMLLRRGALNLANDRGETASEIARAKGEGEIGVLIEEQIKNTHYFDSARFGDRHADLMTSIGNKDTEGVKKLVSQLGPGILHQEDEDNEVFPLERAVETGNNEMVEALLELQANPHAMPLLVNWHTILHTAAEKGSVDVVKTLIDTGGMDPNAVTMQGRTPLQHAMRLEDPNDRADMVESLIELGAICDETMIAEYRELHGDDDAAVLSEIAAAHPPSEEAGQRFALIKAISTGDQEAVSRLLEDNPDNAKISFGTNPAAYALSSQNHEALRALLDKGASMKLSEGPPSTTLLHRAAGMGDAAAVDILIAKMGDPAKMTNSRGESPLHTAAKPPYNREICKKLIQAGFQDEPDILGATPLSYIDDNEVLTTLKSDLEEFRAGRAREVRRVWEEEAENFLDLFPEDIVEEPVVHEREAEPVVEEKRVHREPAEVADEAVRQEVKARDPEEIEEARQEVKAVDPEELEEAVQKMKAPDREKAAIQGKAGEKEAVSKEKVKPADAEELAKETGRKESVTKDSIKADALRTDTARTEGEKQRLSKQKGVKLPAGDEKLRAERPASGRAKFVPGRKVHEEAPERKERVGVHRREDAAKQKESAEARPRSEGASEPGKKPEKAASSPTGKVETPSKEARQAGMEQPAASSTRGGSSQAAKPKEGKPTEMPEEVVVAASSAAGRKEAETGAPRKAVWPPPADWKPASEGERVTAKPSKVQAKSAPEGEGGSAGGGPGGGMGGGAGGSGGEGAPDQEAAPGADLETELTPEFVDTYLTETLTNQEEREAFFLDNYKQLIEIDDALVMEKVFDIVKPDEILAGPENYDSEFLSDLTSMVKEMIDSKPGALEILQDHGLNLVDLVGQDFMFEALKNANGMNVDVLLAGITPEQAGVTTENMSELPTVVQETIREMTPELNIAVLADEAIAEMQKGELDISILKNRKNFRNDSDFKDAGVQFKRAFRKRHGLNKSQMKEVDQEVEKKTGKNMAGVLKENGIAIRDSLQRQVNEMKEQYEKLQDDFYKANRERVAYKKSGNKVEEEKKEAEWKNLKEKIETFKDQFTEYKIRGFQI